MDTVNDQVSRVVPATLERELSMVREAIALVASGGSPRVVLAGLRFGNLLVEPATELALAARVAVVPLWTIDESATDLAVERLPE